MSLMDRAFAAIYDRALMPGEHAGVGDMRQELLSGVSGTVVEIGAGTGLNLVHYPMDIDRLVLCEPSSEMAAKLEGHLATDQHPEHFEVMSAPGEALPLPDSSVDHVVSTLVLCTVDDVERTLGEISRVLRPGGQLHLLEHIVAEKPSMRRVQRVIGRPWTFIARGCRLDRDPRVQMAAAGWSMEISEAHMPGPDSPVSRTIVGHARPA